MSTCAMVALYTPTPLTLDSCRAMDAADPLAPLRAQFDLPASVIYLDGNSLGPLPKAAVAQARTEIERRLVRSPVAGRVLQVNIRAGEFAPAGATLQPLMMVGTVSTLHVRTDVDEHEAWRVKTGAPATAFVKGNKDITFPLRFVRFEPYVLPKRSLTGDSQERVDTRVLQIIYAFEPGDLPVFVGQQVDVYIDDASSPAASESAPAADLTTPAPRS